MKKKGTMNEPTFVRQRPNDEIVQQAAEELSSNHHQDGDELFQRVVEELKMPELFGRIP